MRAMKDSGISYIGEIPQDWELKPLGIYFSEVNTKNFDLEKTIALQFKVGEIIAKPNQKENLSEEDKALLSGYTKVEPNDIIINGLNLNYDFKSLRVARSKMDGAMTSAYIFIRKRDNEDSSYFNYLLKAYDAQKVLHGMGDGIRLTLKFDELKKILVPALTNSEQRGIAAFLDTKCAEVDELLNVQEQFIEELKNYKQALITETVTKGLTPNTKTKQSGIEWIGEIPEEWTTNRGKYLFKVLSGAPFDSGLFTNNPSDFPLIRIRDIQNSNTEAYYSGSFEQEYVVQKGDILVGMDGDFNVAVWKGASALLNQRVCKVHCFRQNVLKAYIYYVLPLLLKRKNELTYATTVKHLSTYDILGFTFPVPPLAEQEEIANYLDQKCAEIDQLIALKQQKAEELREYRKSLIYEYVTGKKQL